jgi:hypothetical protein
MLCGIKWYSFISRKNAYRICEKFNLRKKIGYASKRECWIHDDEPATWKRDGEYRHLFIEVRKEKGGYKLVIRGSIHKFYHDNNIGTFAGLEVLVALQGVFDLFEVEPKEVIIEYIEVGINIPVWFLVFPYLKNNLLFHKKKTKVEFKVKGVGYKFEHDDYLIKIYQKDKHILRYEIKYTSKEKLQKFGIRSGADLHEETINKLALSLIPEWPEVIMRGGLNLVDERNNPNGLTKKEIDGINKFTSEGYMQSYHDELEKARKKKDTKRCEALRVKANRLRRHCMELINDRGDKVHIKLQAMVKEGVSEFLSTWSMLKV